MEKSVQFAKWCSMEGEMKKKRLKGMTKMFEQSVKRWFKIVCRGKILCYFNSKPNCKTLPKGITFITELSTVIPEYKGKKNHLYLSIKGDSRDIHLKIDNTDQYRKWRDALIGLKSYYEGERIFDFLDPRLDYKEKIDVRILNLIMQELESTDHIF